MLSIYLKFGTTVRWILDIPSTELPNEMGSSTSAGHRKVGGAVVVEHARGDHACDEEGCKRHENRPDVVSEEQGSRLNTNLCIIFFVLAAIFGVVDDRPTML